jgi:antitoxin component YwqK of YwqJK toxin-antitoxin module
LLTDYKSTFLSFISATDEHLLTERNGITYTQNEPFTGTSRLKGRLETYPPVITEHFISTGENDVTQMGMRISHYKNGLKDGEERLYYTYPLGSLFGNPEKTELHCITHYRNGLKDGTEIINHIGGDRRIEAQYKDGKLHGIYKEFYYIDYYRKKEFPHHVGQVEKEIEYKNGEISGFYRTYTGYGDTLENYTSVGNKIIDGCRMIEQDDGVKLEWYERGQLVIERIFEYLQDENYKKDISDDYPVDGLLREVYYENGQIKEWIQFNPETGNAYLHKKRIKGTLIEIYNSEAGINRLSEFEEELNADNESKK